MIEVSVNVVAIGNSNHRIARYLSLFTVHDI
jgi:hypothetical protein